MDDACGSFKGADDPLAVKFLKLLAKGMIQSSVDRREACLLIGDEPIDRLPLHVSNLLHKLYYFGAVTELKF